MAQYEKGQAVEVLVQGQWLRATVDYQVDDREIWRVTLEHAAGTFGDGKTGHFDADHIR